MRPEFSTSWLAGATAAIAERAERELEALVAVSSPSGDIHGAEEICAVVAALLPDAAAVERIPCSPRSTPDLLATLDGRGDAGVLLLGHLDTVHGHDEHRPLERRGDRLVGSGTVDMKRGSRSRWGCCARSPNCRRRTPGSACWRSTTRSGGPATSRTGPRFAG